MGSLPGFAGGGQWNYFQRHGMSPGGVPTALIHTPYGDTRVAAAAAGDYTAFFNDLHAAGAPIHSLSGIVIRNKRWGGGLSSHSYGAAIDLDNARYFSPEMKAWVARHPGQWHSALSDHHMLWGHSINAPGGPDDPHIEWGGPGSSASRAIPPHTSRHTETPVVLKLDGRTVATSVLKHTTKMGNRPSSGSPLPDYAGTRPQNIQ
jgi:hypothetical protein